MQLSLLDGVARAERPRKRQRQTARAAYAVQRDRDRAKAAAGQETREGQVLRLLAGYWNALQSSPTALELIAWARARGEQVFDVNSVRPRLTALVEAGLVETAGKRPCRVSGVTVHTWRVAAVGGKG